MGSVIKELGTDPAQSDLRRNSQRTPGLPAVGTSGESQDFRPSGLPTNVETSDAGKQKKHLNLHSLYHVGQKYDGH